MLYGRGDAPYPPPVDRLRLSLICSDTIHRRFTADASSGYISVREHYHRGFHKVVGGKALSLFRPEELELLICGNPELDFEALEQKSKYEDGYERDDDVIKNLWEVSYPQTSNACHYCIPGRFVHLKLLRLLTFFQFFFFSTFFDFSHPICCLCPPILFSF